MLLNKNLVVINKNKTILFMAVGLVVIFGLIISILMINNKPSDSVDQGKISYAKQTEPMNNGSISAIKDVVVNVKTQDNINLLAIKNYEFSVPGLNKKLYAEDFLVTHDNLRKQMVEYCSSNVLSTQTAQLNCNSASKANNLWYMAYWYSSGLINIAFNTHKFFFFVIAVIFLICLCTQCLWRFCAQFYRPVYANHSAHLASGSSNISSH